MRIFIFTTLLIILVGCTHQRAPESIVPTVLTSQDQLEQNIGAIVKIVGVVTNTKIPQIMGVDIRSDDPDLRGEMAMAIGVLESWSVSESDIEEMNAEHVAHRGPGVFYRLKEVASNYRAQVQPAAQQDDSDGTPLRGAPDL